MGCQPKGGESFDIVAVSGTSAGALCALAAWYGLAPKDSDAECGTLDKAIERLDFLWTTFAATTPAEVAHNQLVGALLQWTSKGMPFPASNPYGAHGKLGMAGLSMMGARPEYLGFPALLEALCPNFDTIDWPAVAKADLRILVGAIEVLSGNFEVFDSDKTLEKMGLLPDGPKFDQYDATRWRMRRSLSLAGVAASGTLPEILPAQVIADTVFPTGASKTTVTRNGYYWDGLFSQNPPVRNLLDAATKQQKPDEIWVVRINPQEFNPASLTIGLDDIRDRENDLAGNLSLDQELDKIPDHQPMDQRTRGQASAVEQSQDRRSAHDKMIRQTAWGLHHTSKFDRSADHYGKLRDEGQQVAEQWLFELADARQRLRVLPERRPLSGACWSTCSVTGLLGILAALGVLIWLSFRGWSVLVLAPAAALIAAIAAGEPLLAHWTQTLWVRPAVRRPVLSPVPARRPVRKAHGRQRIG